MQSIELTTAEQVSDLIERPITSIERTADLGRGIVALMADTIDEIIDTLLRRHLFQMEAQRENDSRAAVHVPEQHANLVLRRLRKVHVPKQKLPVKRPAFAPKWCAEQASIWLVALSHEALQMMTGD